MIRDASTTLRPRDLAVLLLASSDLLPRQRARDQQADRAGMELKRQLLERLAYLDPEPDALEIALTDIVDQFGPPTGPTRAMARSFLEDWQAACVSPEWIEQLLEEAVRDGVESKQRGKRISK